MAKKSRIPSYRKHSLRDFAFVEHARKRIPLPGRYNSAESRAAYAAFVAQLRAGEEPSLPLTPTEVAVADVVRHALDEAARRYLHDGKPTQEYGHFRTIADVLLDACPALPAVEFGPRMLKTVRDKMVERGWCRQQVNRQVGRLIRLFRWAAADELVPAAIPAALREIEPLRQGRTTAREMDPVRPVDLDLVDATIPWVGPVVGTMIRLQSLTGMRSQSICGLRACDLTVVGDCLVYLPPEHKCSWRGKSLAVPLGPRAIALLLPWLERDPEAFVFSPRESEEIRRADQRTRRKSRVQPSQMDRRTRRPQRSPGDSYDTQTYYRAIQRGIAKLNAARAEAGFPTLPAWHPHQLRHAVATEVRRRFGLEAAQVYLGHARADVTQIYAEKDLALAVRVSREMG